MKPMRMAYSAAILCSFMLLLQSVPAAAATDTKRVTVSVSRVAPGAPVTLGIPFPVGELYSPDHVRVLNESGQEIASQITSVTTWLPADESIKWIWAFFFADHSGRYTIEYGADVRSTVQVSSPIEFRNNQRENGFAEINTGPLRIRVNKAGSGFIDRVEFNPAGSGFGEEHLIATGIRGRGSFLDLMDQAGIDTSSAVIHQHYIEKGSGPMHAILRIEGEYRYGRNDHPASPFVTYIHAYAGKSYLRVLHTITYTGIPDRSAPLEGRQHMDIATQKELIIAESERRADAGLTQPKDMIVAAGIGLDLQIGGNPVFRTAVKEKDWWEDAEAAIVEVAVNGERSLSVMQSGPEPNRIPPVSESDFDQRISGFYGRVQSDRGVIKQAQRLDDWADLSDARRGISVGIRNMLQEYPKEISIDLEKGRLHLYSWPPSEVPKSFQRWSDQPDGGMVGNFASGITKTTEFSLNFHAANDDVEQTREAVYAVLHPVVPHAGADWYRHSGVYGTFASANNDLPILERSLQYKYQYMKFSQHWAPWYGMFDYGDMKAYVRNTGWVMWSNNEPAQDFQWWLNFMRTGDPGDFLTAEAMSRHTMDVDNTHWPRGPVYRGDTNSALDYWHSLDQPAGSPYVGMGHRHANQQAISMLSAHVWVPGWLASYYLNGYHRGLAVARLTGDYYLRRIFGEHDLTGRRLYLSIWNLAELYDATKDEVYRAELQDRVRRALALQRLQGGAIAIDRYGYSQNYVSHGLSKYLQLFPDREVELALIENARSLLQNPSLDHEMESYLATIHPLLLGYDLTGNQRFLEEACRRSVHLRMDELSRPVNQFATQRELIEALERVSHLPEGRGPWGIRGGQPIWTFTNGLRAYGWTHAFGLPYLIDRLGSTDHKLSNLPCAAASPSISQAGVTGQVLSK